MKATLTPVPVDRATVAGSTLEELLTHLRAMLIELRDYLAKNGTLPTHVAFWYPDDVVTPEFARFMGYPPSDCGQVYMRQLAAQRAIALSLGIEVRYDRRTSTEMGIALRERGLAGHSGYDPNVWQAIEMIVEATATAEHTWEVPLLSADTTGLAKHIIDMMQNEVPAFSRELERAVDCVRHTVEQQVHADRAEAVDHGLSTAAMALARGRMIRRDPMTEEDEILYRALYRATYGPLP